MKTKALLLAGLVSAAAAVSSVAQTVFSVNAVGYVNLTVPPGFSMIANPLVGADNKVSALFPGMPNNTQLYKWNGATYTVNVFRTALGGWVDPNMTLVPGEGAFIRNPTATNLIVTFTGEVAQGNLVTPVPAGFSIVSSQVPQSAALDTGLGFPVAQNDAVFRFDNAMNRYQTYTFRNGAWLGGDVPVPAVGESFFVRKNVATSWNRNFSVNN